MTQTLRRNFKDPYRRKVFAARLGGKMIGVTLVMAFIYAFTWFFSTQAGAAVPGQAAIKTLDVVNSLNTVWVLVTAFLVFCMQAGFMMLEGGFAREREVSNIMIECVVDTGLCGVLFYAFGFAFMFSAGNGWIGYHYFFLQGVPHTYGTTGVAFMAFWLFQFAFADTARHDRLWRHGRPRTASQGRPALQHRRHRFHLPDLRPLGVGAERLARYAQHLVPRQLRRLHGRAHDRRCPSADRCHRGWAAPWTQVQA